MTPPAKVLVFSIGEHRLALPLESVERVLAAVELTPLPAAPAVVRGLIDLHGQIVPMIDMSPQFSIPPRPITPEGRMILVRTIARRIAVLADAVLGVRTLDPDRALSATGRFPGTLRIEGAAELDGEIVVIADVETCLAACEDSQLVAALEIASAKETARP